MNRTAFPDFPLIFQWVGVTRILYLETPPSNHSTEKPHSVVCTKFVQSPTVSSFSACIQTQVALMQTSCGTSHFPQTGTSVLSGLLATRSQNVRPQDRSPSGPFDSALFASGPFALWTIRLLTVRPCIVRPRTFRPLDRLTLDR